MASTYSCGICKAKGFRFKFNVCPNCGSVDSVEVNQKIDFRI